MKKAPNQLLSFYYNDQLYIRVIPGKKLFNSTLIHEVVNRGDVFALHVESQQLTIVPGKSDVTHTKINVDIPVNLDPYDLFSSPISID
jgi:hypothetical protein